MIVISSLLQDNFVKIEFFLKLLINIENMEKDELVENYLKKHGLELMHINDIIPSDSSDDEILHQRLTSYILIHAGIKRSRILSEYYYKTVVFLKSE